MISELWLTTSLVYKHKLAGNKIEYRSVFAKTERNMKSIQSLITTQRYTSCAKGLGCLKLRFLSLVIL